MSKRKAYDTVKVIPSQATKESKTFMKKILLCALLVSGCKSARQTTDDPMTRAIILKTTGLPEANKYPKAAELQVKSCAEATSGTAPDSGGVIKLQAANVKKNEKCLVRVYSPTPDPEDEFVGDAGVYFMAKNVSLREDSLGQLIGIVNFQATSKKKLPPAAAGCAVDFPVVFPEDIPAGPVTASLVCTPAITAIGTFTAGTGKKGTFNFKIPVTSDNQKRNCTLIDIGADGGGKWFQSVLTPGIDVSVKDACQNTIAEATLSSYKKSDADDVDVNIEHIFK